VNIVVTGSVGVGKTTVCQKVIELARSRGYICGGIITPKAPDKGIIVVNIQSGESKPLASISEIYQGPHTDRYFFNPEAIEFGNRAIDSAVSADILLVDEVGHLELRDEGFTKALEVIKAGRVKNSILVIRSKLLPAFLARLGAGASIIETTVKNRDHLPHKIGKLLRLSEIN
jgi:nucleoside-triphosphatase THEP1